MRKHIHGLPVAYFPGFSNSQQVCTWVRDLREQWKKFAMYMGFTRDEVQQIERSSNGTLDDQCKIFLRVWWMPNCEKALEILEEAGLKARVLLSNSAVGKISILKISSYNYS